MACSNESHRRLESGAAGCCSNESKPASLVLQTVGGVFRGFEHAAPKGTALPGHAKGLAGILHTTPACFSACENKPQTRTGQTSGGDPGPAGCSYFFGQTF